MKGKPKILLEDEKKVSAEWRDLPCGCMRRPNIVILLKIAYIFNTITSLFPYESLLVFNYKLHLEK